jgi:hypothetical protein
MADKEKMRRAFGDLEEEDAGGDVVSSDQETKELETKAFFEAGKAGNYKKAVEHFATMMELCGAYGE